MLSVLLAAGLLTGCGNTGDLYLPDAAAKPKKVPRIVEPATESNTKDKDDESGMETKP